MNAAEVGVIVMRGLHCFHLFVHEFYTPEAVLGLNLSLGGLEIHDDRYELTVSPCGTTVPLGH